MNNSLTNIPTAATNTPVVMDNITIFKYDIIPPNESIKGEEVETP